MSDVIFEPWERRMLCRPQTDRARDWLVANVPWDKFIMHGFDLCMYPSYANLLVKRMALAGFEVELNYPKRTEE